MQLLKVFARGAPLVLNRICQAVARVFVNTYPHQWANFFTDMMPLAKNELFADDANTDRIDSQQAWLQLMKVHN
jgi:hypothetical protein